VETNAARTGFHKVNVGNAVKNTAARSRLPQDIPLLVEAYKLYHGCDLGGDMRYKVHYWSRLIAHRKVSGHRKRLCLRLGGFIRRSVASDGKVIPAGAPSTGWRQEGVFYQIDRIATILIGSQRRCFLLCWPMSKVGNRAREPPGQDHQRNRTRRTPRLLGSIHKQGKPNAVTTPAAGPPTRAAIRHDTPIRATTPAKRRKNAFAKRMHRHQGETQLDPRFNLAGRRAYSLCR